MPIACQAYYTVRERLRVFLCGASKPQLTNLSLMVFGLFAAGNCQLPRIATKMPLLVPVASLTQRLRRLLMNKAIEPATAYQPVARFLLACFAGGSIRFRWREHPPHPGCHRSGRQAAGPVRGRRLPGPRPAAGLADAARAWVQRVQRAEGAAVRSGRPGAAVGPSDASS